MPITYQALIYSAVNNANKGAPSVVANAEFIAQTLFAEVSQSVCEAAAANEYRRSLLRREKAVTLVAGSAVLDDDVLTHYMADSTLIDPAVLTRHYAWRDYPDFIRRGDPRLGVYTVRGTLLQVIDPQASFTVPLTTTGARTLTVPCVVVPPAVYTDLVDAPDELISDLIDALSEALRGAMPMAAAALT